MLIAVNRLRKGTVMQMPSRLMDDGTAAEFARNVGRFIEDNCTHLVANMIRCRNGDEAGVKTLLEAQTLARQKGGDLVLSNVSRQMERLLQDFPGAEKLRRFDSEAEAIDSFKIANTEEGA